MILNWFTKCPTWRNPWKTCMWKRDNPPRSNVSSQPATVREECQRSIAFVLLAIRIGCKMVQGNLRMANQTIEILQTKVRWNQTSTLHLGSLCWRWRYSIFLHVDCTITSLSCHPLFRSLQVCRVESSGNDSDDSDFESRSYVLRFRVIRSRRPICSFR